MARPETLTPGNCYFSVAYYDSDLVLPMIDTLVYVGQENDDEGRIWLFKEPESPSDLDEQNSSPEPPALIGFSDTQLHEVLDFKGLMQKLREIAADHPLKRVAQPVAEPATAEEFESVPGNVTEFLSDPEYVSLTITIRFTDDGLSLGRRDGGYDVHLFTHPRRDPDEASKILSLFADLGVRPLVDYLCDRGRTRVLQFPLPAEHDSLVDLCRRILTEVHSMRRGDALDYRFLKQSDLGS